MVYIEYRYLVKLVYLCDVEGLPGQGSGLEYKIQLCEKDFLINIDNKRPAPTYLVHVTFALELVFGQLQPATMDGFLLITWDLHLKIY